MEKDEKIEVSGAFLFKNGYLEGRGMKLIELTALIRLICPTISAQTITKMIKDEYDFGEKIVKTVESNGNIVEKKQQKNTSLYILNKKQVDIVLNYFGGIHIRKYKNDEYESILRKMRNKQKKINNKRKNIADSLFLE